MLNKLSMLSSKPEKIAKAFSRCGWIGFWLQAVLATLPVILFIYVLFFCDSASFQRGAIGVIEYLALIGMALLVFTIFWSYRYTRMAKKMSVPETCPRKPTVLRTLWIGLLAGCLGIFVAMALMTIEVARLLFVFLRAPQGGVPVMQTETSDPSGWVSAIDMVGLLADLSVLGAELILLALTLWLVFRMTTAKDYEASPEPQH